jgi:MEDS: MEthanogen/methylotroph, DcmR Sensory domain
MREFSIGRSKVSRYLHVCGFFNSREEQFEVLLPFCSEAITKREKLVNIVNPRLRDDHLRRLGSAGIDVEGCAAGGQLEVLGWDTVYLEGGHFDQHKMLTAIEDVFAAGRAAGYTAMRLTGEMGWALEGRAGSEQLVEYEARVNAVLTRNEQPGVCIYDTAELSGSMMMDILRAHPLTLVGGIIHENPFYLEPELLLRELAARRATRQVAAG